MLRSLKGSQTMQNFDRRSFLEMSAILGMGCLLNGSLETKSAEAKAFKGSVIVIGAGAAGMSAGLHLKQMGIPFTILEAAETHGGRMKVDRDFTDFPIPLGAEWLHVRPSVFSKIAGNDAKVATIGYRSSDPYWIVSGSDIIEDELGGYADRKFINSSWFDFFDQFVLPEIKSEISFGENVKQIAYSADGVTVSSRSGKQYTADRVIVTVPLKMLQSGAIKFIPPLPSSKQRAIQAAEAWPGIKMFFEFSEKFYPTFVEYDLPSNAGIKNYYDAAYGQNTNRAILGLFAVGHAALPFIDGDPYSRAIAELDEIFDGSASRHYRKHIVQNWVEEPHIKSAYISDNENSGTVRKLYQPVRRRVFFAGEAYTKSDDWGSVHTAALAAKSVVGQIVKRG